MVAMIFVRRMYNPTLIMTVDAWLKMAAADAGARDLPALPPLLEGLAQATRRLRGASFNDDARGAGAASGPAPSGNPAE
jgi:hypothetical protein